MRLELGGERTSDDRANAAVALVCEVNKFVSLPAVDLRPDVHANFVLTKLAHLLFS